jgi:hypothetical protein
VDTGIGSAIANKFSFHLKREKKKRSENNGKGERMMRVFSSSGAAEPVDEMSCLTAHCPIFTGRLCILY